jgi:hypothetical protein
MKLTYSEANSEKVSDRGLNDKWCETLSTIPSAQTLIAPADADQLTCTRLPKKLLDKDRFEPT